MDGAIAGYVTQDADWRWFWACQRRGERMNSLWENLHFGTSDEAKASARRWLHGED